MIDTHVLTFLNVLCFLSVSLFFRGAGHSACEKSVPSSPARSTLAASLLGSAAPNAWVSDGSQVTYFGVLCREWSSTSWP